MGHEIGAPESLHVSCSVPESCPITIDDVAGFPGARVLRIGYPHGITIHGSDDELTRLRDAITAHLGGEPS